MPSVKIDDNQTVEQWYATVESRNEQSQSIIITANQRLTRHLLKKLSENTAYLKSLSPVRVMSFQQFIASFWQSAQNKALPNSNKLMISGNMEEFVWSQIVEANTDLILKDQDQHLVPSSFAKDISQAYQIERQWQLQQKELEQHTNPQVDLYLTLKKRFNEHLKHKPWLTQYDAIEQICTFFNTGALTALSNMALYGFVEINPLQQKLIDHSAKHITQLQTPQFNGFKGVVQFNDTISQLKHIASWANHIINTEPNSTIGIIIPGLHKQKALVERIFTQQFAPHMLLHPNFNHIPNVPFEISLGSPLLEEPIIFDALQSLSLAQHKIHTHEAQNIINSPFWGNGLTPMRPQALAKLQQWDRDAISCSDLLSLLQPKAALTDAPLDAPAQNETATSCVHYAIKGRAYIKSHQHKRYSFYSWGKILKQWLTEINWPGTRVVNSREYQASQIFIQVLDELKNDDVFALGSQTKTFNECISHIKRRAHEKVFQLQVVTKPIQLIGALEAVGLEFDHSWLCDVTRENFPAQTALNPFLPHAVQTAFSTPKSTPEKELDYAKVILKLFTSNAPQACSSFCSTQDDQEQSVSPLLGNEQSLITPEKIASNPLEQLYSTLIEADSLTVAPTKDGLSLKSTHTLKLKSGVAALQNIAIDPFIAYTIHRLGAQQPEQKYIGLSPRDKGNVLHNVLCDYWQQTKTHEQNEKILNQSIDSKNNLLPSCELEENLRQSVTQYVNESIKNKRGLIPEPFLLLEIQRLTHIVFESLLRDKKRPDFTVLEVEKNFTVSLKSQQNVEFDIKIDRIDQTCNNELLVIDYKSGRTNIKDTIKKPLTSTQLPIYSCIPSSESISGVSFSHIASHSQGYSGYGVFQEPIDGIDTSFTKIDKTDELDDWPTLIHFWHNELKYNLDQLISGRIQTQMANTHNAALPFFEFTHVITRQFEQSRLNDIWNEKQNKELN